MDLKISQLYTRKFEISRNAVLSVEPPSINFEFKKINETYHALVKLNNIYGKPLHVYILPQLSKYFRVDLVYKTQLLPGFPLTLYIHFTADELREYSDWLKIICNAGDSNLMIPLHAEPFSHYNFPKKINLGTVCLGDMVSGKFSIPSSIEKDIKFLIYLPEPSNDFCVEPLAGLIKQNDPPTSVIVKFRPTRYITVQFPIQLYIPLLSTSPFTITVVAYCKPGLAREKIPLETTTATKKSIVYQRPQKPLVSEKKIQPIEEEKEEDPIEALKKLNTVHGVVKFLLAKEPTGPSEHEIIGPMGRYANEDRKIYQNKEKQFREAMAKFKADNQAALLHQRDKLGQPLQISLELMEQVLTQRLAEQEEFENLLKTETPDQTRRRRVIRKYDDIPDTTFTDEPSDLWFVKFQALLRFIQAVRHVIINNRLCKRLEVIKNARDFIEMDLEQQAALEAECLAEKHPEEEKEVETDESPRKEEKKKKKEKGKKDTKESKKKKEKGKKDTKESKKKKSKKH